MTDQNQDQNQDEVPTGAGEAPQLDTTDTGDNSDTTDTAEGSDDSDTGDNSDTTDTAEGSDDSELPKDPLEKEVLDEASSTTNVEAGPEDWEPSAPELQATQSSFQVTPADAQADPTEDLDTTVPSVVIVSRFITNVLKIAHPASAELEVTSKQLDAYRAHLGYVYSVPAHLAEASVQHLDILPKDVQAAICLGAIPDLTEEGN